MNLRKIINNYNFHDCKIIEIVFDQEENNENLMLRLEKKLQDKTEYFNCTFKKVSNLKPDNIKEFIGEYILNIWVVKNSKNLIEIVIDNDNYSSFYFNAEEIVINIE